MDITIVLVEEDCASVRRDLIETEATGPVQAKDKFMVMTAAMDAGFVDQYQALAATASKKITGGDEKEAAAEVSSAKAAVAAWWAGKAKDDISALKIRGVFVLDEPAAAAAGSNAATPAQSAAAADGGSRRSPSGASPAGGDDGAGAAMSQESMLAELFKYRKEHDELSNFTVNLTAERDFLFNELESTKKALQRALSDSGAAAGKVANAADPDAPPPPPTAAGFGLTPMAIVAVVGWMLGRFLG